MSRSAIISVAVAAAVAVLASATPFARADAAPPKSAPADPMPNPNGFDYVVKATGMVVEPEVVAQVIKDPSTLRNPAIMKQAVAVLQQNEPAVATLREGLRYPYRTPPHTSVNQLLPYLGKMRSLARVLAFEADVDWAQGNADEALHSSLDGIAYGAEIPAGGNMIHDLVGDVCEAIARKVLWQNAGRLSTAQCQIAIARLIDVEAHRVSLADILRVEKHDSRIDLESALHAPDWPNAAGAYLGEEAAQTPAIRQQLQGSAGAPGAILANLDACWDARIAAAALPYGSAPPPGPTPTPIVDVLLPGSLDGYRFRHVCDDAQTALLTTALALQAYYLAHGSYPSNLDALVPEFLTAVPSDPFTQDAPLHYRKSAGKPLLYSVGPDGKDDGGKPVYDRTNTNNPNIVSKDSKGDIVAGVNGW